jgi:hypothetical protein
VQLAESLHSHEDHEQHFRERLGAAAELGLA